MMTIKAHVLFLSFFWRAQNASVKINVQIIDQLYLRKKWRLTEKLEKWLQTLREGFNLSLVFISDPVKMVNLC